MKYLVAAVVFGALSVRAQSISCTQAMAPPSVQLAGSPSCTASSCSYTDSTPLNGATYGYVSVATDMAGSACSNIVASVVIPPTGAHSVALTFVPSTTPNVTYAVFRAVAPASPVGLSAIVN